MKQRKGQMKKIWIKNVEVSGTRYLLTLTVFLAESGLGAQRLEKTQQNKKSSS